MRRTCLSLFYYPLITVEPTSRGAQYTHSSHEHRTHTHTHKETPPTHTPHSAHSIIKILVPLRGQGWTLLSPAPLLADARGLGKRVRCPKGESTTGSKQNGFDTMSARPRSLGLDQRRCARNDESHPSEGVQLARQRHLRRTRVRLGEAGSANAGGPRIQSASPVAALFRYWRAVRE